MTREGARRAQVDDGERPLISTFVPTCEHEHHLRLALESALMQRGAFDHEIVVADDGSVDGTAAVAAEYACRHPGIVRDVGSPVNRGISANFRTGFAACRGELVAILEGDDYWVDPGKLEAQRQFLKANPDCAMVFSRMLRHDLGTGERGIVASQVGLGRGPGPWRRLHARDLMRHPSMNPIMNFSTCMIRREALLTLPDILYRGRLSEVALAFHLETLGRVGFIDRPMSVHLRHDRGVWGGADPLQRLEDALAIRRVALEVARPELRPRLLRLIRERFEEPIRRLREEEAGRRPPRPAGSSA